MKTFFDYDLAKACARQLASLGGPDAGIWKTREWGRTVYNVKFLPKKENCVGHETMMERVTRHD